MLWLIMTIKVNIPFFPQVEFSRLHLAIGQHRLFRQDSDMQWPLWGKTPSITSRIIRPAKYCPTNRAINRNVHRLQRGPSFRQLLVNFELCWSRCLVFNQPKFAHLCPFSQLNWGVVVLAEHTKNFIVLFDATHSAPDNGSWSGLDRVTLKPRNRSRYCP